MQLKNWLEMVSMKLNKHISSPFDAAICVQLDLPITTASGWPTIEYEFVELPIQYYPSEFDVPIHALTNSMVLLASYAGYTTQAMRITDGEHSLTLPVAAVGIYKDGSFAEGTLTYDGSSYPLVKVPYVITQDDELIMTQQISSRAFLVDAFVIRSNAGIEYLADVLKCTRSVANNVIINDRYVATVGDVPI